MTGYRAVIVAAAKVKLPVFMPKSSANQKGFVQADCGNVFKWWLGSDDELDIRGLTQEERASII